MINQVVIVGRLTKEPEIKKTGNGIPFLNVSLAVNRQYKNEQGLYEADFIQCTLWRKLAEHISTYCEKGSLVGITGRIQTRNYQDSSGKRQFVTEVIAEGLTFLEKKREPLPF